jgi:hypothetical protein
MLSYLLADLEPPLPMVILSCLAGVTFISIIFLKAPKVTVSKKVAARMRSKSI